jgi:hypothetical protein
MCPDSLGESARESGREDRERKRRHPMNRSRFSTTVVLKIFVVVFVLVLVIGEALPSLFNVSGKKKIDEATQAVCGKILLTRQKAVAAHTRYRIHYDYQTGACATYRETSPGRWLPEVPEPGRMPEGVVMSPTSTPPDGYIEIDADGRIENHGMPVVIRFADGKGTQKSIRVSPAGLVQETPTW